MRELSRLDTDGMAMATLQGGALEMAVSSDWPSDGL
jgi:hypothetical protein